MADINYVMDTGEARYEVWRRTVFACGPLGYAYNGETAVTNDDGMKVYVYAIDDSLGKAFGVCRKSMRDPDARVSGDDFLERFDDQTACDELGDDSEEDGDGDYDEDECLDRLLRSSAYYRQYSVLRKMVRALKDADNGECCDER